MKRGLIFLTLSLVTILSCKKTESVENTGIVGKWELRQIFDGYVNGGHFMWSNVPKKNSHTLEFTSDGQFFRKENINGNLQECSGTYQLAADSTLTVSSDCSTTIETMKVSELTGRTLIINYAGIEGTIRYKYSAIK